MLMRRCYLNRYAACVQKAVQDTFDIRLVAIADHLRTFFQQLISMISMTADEAVCDTVMSLQDDFAHCHSNMQERIERLARQCGFQGEPRSSQDVPPVLSVIPVYAS